MGNAEEGVERDSPSSPIIVRFGCGARRTNSISSRFFSALTHSYLRRWTSPNSGFF